MADLKSFREELNNKISLVDYISKKVPLRPKGKDWWGCCPFHKEKTPSFSVNEDKGFYHCFGCGAHGDLVQFEIETTHCSFMEAIHTLADFTGLKVPEFKPRNPENEKKALKYLEIMETTARLYSKSLFEPVGKDALNYLHSRGLTNEIIKLFRLGYAPNNHLVTRTFIKEPDSNLFASELVRKSQKFGRNYDFFRDRLMFPICDSADRVIAFSGRIMSGEGPKYINLPETDFFKKRHTLYGLNLAKQAIRKKNRAIVVEGQIDAIMLHHAGFNETVAPLGTAFTKEHFAILLKFTNEITFCFDGDEAGHSAAYKTAMLVLPLLQSKFKISVIILSNKQDPDDVIKASGPAGFEFLLNRAIPLFDYLWGYAKNKYDISKPESRAECEKELMIYANMITDGVLKKYLIQYYKNKIYKEWRDTPKKKEQKPLPQAYNADEKMLVAVLFQYPELASEYSEFLSTINLTTPELDKLFKQARAGESLEIIPIIIGNELKMIKKSKIEEAKSFIELIHLKCQKKSLEHELSMIAEKMMTSNDENIKQKYEMILQEINRVQNKILDL